MEPPTFPVPNSSTRSILCSRTFIKFTVPKVGPHFAGPGMGLSLLAPGSAPWLRQAPPLPSPTFWGQFWKKVLTGPCPSVSLVSMNESQARKARKQLLRELPDPTEILRGSLLDRRIFHRRGCRKCRRGEGHRVWVLTVGYPGGRTRQFTVPAEHKGQVQRWLRNYRKLRAKLEAICELNHELLGADP